MRHTIKGITDRTITFNSLGITVRGNCSNLAQYPHSIARSIDIKTEDQWNEINAMMKAGLISIESEERPVQKPQKPHKTPKLSSKTSKEKTPKSSKKAKTVKRISRVEDNVSEAVVVTADGLVSKGRMTKSSDLDLQESEVTKASMEAARQIEEEERKAKNAKPIDESKLDISERMGNDVVVSGSEGTKSKVKISRSALPTVKTNWIDLEKDFNNNPDNAFIDGPPEPDTDEKDDRFIE